MKKQKKDKIKIKYNCTYDSLQIVIDYFRKLNIPLSEVILEYDYTGCYYEDDPPSIVAVYNEK